jgi:hypothetical protein
MGLIVTLMQQQRNRIFKLIEYSGLDPRDFRLEQVKDQNNQFPKVTHVSTGAYFLFGFNDDRDLDRSEWAPGHNTAEDEAPARTWDDRETQLNQWLGNVKREYYEPDLWQQSAAAFGGESADDNTLFSSDERVEISEQLRKVLDYIVEQRELSASERERLEISFVLPLEDASGKLTRGQFKLILVGALINTGVQIGLHSEGLQDLMGFAYQALGHLFGGLPQLPA